jgi:beta-N-acetylhexosaminidase
MVDPTRAPKVMGAPRHLAQAQRITDRTTTLVKNDAGLLPLAAGSRKVLVAGWGVDATRGIASAIAARGAATQVLESGTAPSAAQIDAAVAATQSNDLVVVSTNNAYAIDASTGQPTASAAAQTRLVRALLATGKPVVVAAMRNPYDVASFPEAPTVLDTYGYTADQTESLVRVLVGEVNPHGRLPVSIPRTDGTGDLFPFGHGLGY